MQLTDLYGGGSTGSAVALQPDGKIVVAGTTVVPAIASFVSRLAIARFLSDGALDSSFSRDERASHLPPPSDRPEGARRSHSGDPALAGQLSV